MRKDDAMRFIQGWSVAKTVKNHAEESMEERFRAIKILFGKSVLKELKSGN